MVFRLSQFFFVFDLISFFFWDCFYFKNTIVQTNFHDQTYLATSFVLLLKSIISCWLDYLIIAFVPCFIMLVKCCKRFSTCCGNKILNKANKNINYIYCLFLSFIVFQLGVQINKQFALLKGSGNKSKHRLSLLIFFANGGLPKVKKFCRFEQRSMLKK